MRRTRAFLFTGLVLALLLGAFRWLGTPAAQAAPGQAAASTAALPLLNDFEGGMPEGWFDYGDYGSGTSINRSLVVTDTPAHAGTNVLSIAYTSAGWGAGTGNNLGGQDWSSYDGFAFWFQGANTGGTFRVILSDNPNPEVSGDSAERFAYEFTDNSSGWRYIAIPWALFFRDTAFQPNGAPNDGLTLTNVQAYALALPVGTAATVALDDVALYKGEIVTDFLIGIPGTWFQYGDYGSGTAINYNGLVTETPGNANSEVLSITYTSAGWGAGVGNNLSYEDWSSYDGFSFWFQGANTGGTFRVILSDNPNPEVSGDSAERFAYEFTDNSSDWRYIAIPWALFFRDTTFQPNGAPDDGLTLTEMQAYALALPVGTAATVLVDDFGLFGTGQSAVTVGFSSNAYSVIEGESALITVTLNATTDTSVEVDYFTSEGSASSNSDYTPVSGTLTIPAGELSATFAVPTSDDSEDELNETVSLVLANPVGAAMTNYMAQLTIVDNDETSLPTGLPLVDNFEGELPSGWFQYGDYGSGSAISPSLVVTDSPASSGISVLAVEYTSAGWGAGTGRNVESEDWSGYDGIRFWFKGANTGGTLRFILSDNPNPAVGGDSAERFAYEFVDNSADWRLIFVPWSSFFRDYAFQPGGALDDGLTLTKVQAYALALPVGTAATVHLDDIRLFNFTVVDAFDGEMPTGWFQYGDYGSGTAIATNLVITATSVVTEASVLEIDYTSAGWGAGTGHTIDSEDWSKTDGFSFWFKGANTGGTFRLILSDNLNPDVGGDSAERFAFEWTDNSSDWRLVAIPWGSFFRDYAFQPGGAPDDGLTLTSVQAYAFALPTGTSGKVYVEDVRLFGGPVGLQVGFLNKALSVTEGQNVEVTVSLNMTSGDPVQVDYATSDGSANAGSDYTANSGTLTIPAGSLSASFVIATQDDSEAEGNETINLTLSNPVSASLGSAASAVITIQDNDEAPPPPVGDHSVIVDNYELASLPSGVDANNIGVGFVTWNAPGASASITLTVPAQQVPGKGAGNQVMQLDLNLGAGQWGGFTHAFENETVDGWVSQDWSSYEGVSFWLYGNNTGSVIFVDIQDNRTPGSTKDDAERWSVDIKDEFSGWKYFQIPFSQFNRKDIGNGAPFDGFGKTEIWGYAFGGFNTIANQSYYIDDFGLMPRTTVVDDYELASLPSGVDANNIGVGFVTWNAPGASASITLTVPAQQVPGKAAGNQVMQLDLNLGAGQWGGFTHAFENETVDGWVSQDWSSYEGICFWLYGNNTGSVIFVDIQDNRTPGSTKDDAERWSVDIKDEFSGWKFFQIPFSQFNRKDIGNGAPFDGFGKTEIWGYAFGGFNTIANQSYYIDDVTLYGNVGGGEETLKVAFDAANYTAVEGSSGVLTVSLSSTSTEEVTVEYKSVEGQATPDRDYTPVSGTLVFAPGVQEMTISVPTLDDDKTESDELVMVNLYNPQGAAFGFQRRASLTIRDNDPANPSDLGSFDGSHPFTGVGSVSLSITELAAGDGNALPGQGAHEQVLSVQYDSASSTANRITNSFTQPQDWSNAGGLTFWYFGNNTGQNIFVELLDNQIASTNEMTSTDWVLRWADEFNEAAGTPPNPNNWKHELGDGTLNGIPGWGNSEFEYYTNDPENASTDGAGNLRIRLTAVNTETTDLVCYYGPCRYTSARLITQDRAAFQYGKIEARMKLPDGPDGLWPAFWALGTDIGEVGWPQTGEIDIMEYVSRIPNEIFGTLHGPGYSGGASYGKTVSIPNLTDDFHTYAVEWRENHIIWYVDGVKFHEARNTDAFLNGKEWVYNHPFFLLLNVAIGGNFGGSISPNLTFPQDTLVDYVRVYQAADSAERFEASFVDNFSGWQQVTIPFGAFTRSSEQPAGAPNDGLTLTAVNGYGFRFPSSPAPVTAQAVITTHIDQVRLLINRWHLFPIFK